MKILKNILRELITIRKELQNIRVILESQFIPNYKSTFVDHKLVRTYLDPEAQLKDLRKFYNIDQ